jgi:hypothetical protein
MTETSLSLSQFFTGGSPHNSIRDGASNKSYSSIWIQSYHIQQNKNNCLRQIKRYDRAVHIHKLLDAKNILSFGCSNGDVFTKTSNAEEQVCSRNGRIPETKV